MRFYLFDPDTLEFRELEGRVIVGRDRGDWIFPREKELSSEHLRFRVDGGRVLVEDLGSSNGVRIDGERIPALEERELPLLGRVRFGPKEWILSDSDQRIPRQPTPPQARATPEIIPEATSAPREVPKKSVRRSPSLGRLFRQLGGLLLLTAGIILYDAAFLWTWVTEQAHWTLLVCGCVGALGVTQIFSRSSGATRMTLALGVVLALALAHLMSLERSRFAFAPIELMHVRACPSWVADPILRRARPQEHALLQDACRIHKLKHALDAHTRAFCGERGAGFDCYRESAKLLQDSRSLTATGDAALFFLGAFWIRRDYGSNSASLLKTTGRAVEWIARAVSTFSDPNRRAEIRPALIPLLVGPGVPASLNELARAIAPDASATLTEESGTTSSLRKLFGIE